MGVDWNKFEKRFLKQERMEKDREQRKIMHEVFDGFTIDTLFRMAGKGELDRLEYVVSTGKEANVFRGTLKDGTVRAYKIYRMETSDFKAMWKYIEGDRRFKNVRHNKRSIVLAWASKELRNLKVAFEAGCHVPEPFYQSNNVLAMQFIGNKHAAPLLKDSEVKDPEKVFNIIANDLQKMHQANLVHADVSEYNIMLWKQTPYLIDIGQGVLLTHPYAEEFLKRDVYNLVRYFKKLGVKKDANEVLAFIKQGS